MLDHHQRQKKNATRTWSVASACMFATLVGATLVGSLTGIGCRGKDAEVSKSNSSSATAEDEIASIAGLTPQQASLSAERQKHVWDAEHATHLIEHRFGVQFRKSLRSNSASELAGYMVEDAPVELVDWQQATLRELSTVSSSKSNADATRSSSNRDGLARWILQLYAARGETSKHSLRVLVIEAAESEGSWLATLLLTEQSTSDSGETKRIESEHQVKFVWNEVDELVSSSPVKDWRVNSVRISSAGKPLMVEVTRAAGLHRVPIQDNWQLPAGKQPQMVRFQMAVADYDRDGALDVALSSAGNNLLLRFVGGQFKPLIQQVGIHPTSRGKHVDISASWIDYDNDGYPDLILGGRLYHNESGKQFTDVTATCGIEFHPHHMGCAVADYNMDGLADVYFVYAHDSQKKNTTNEAWIGDEQSGGKNQLWKNQGDGTFVDATAQAGVEGGQRQSFAANWVFADSDHYPDLYVANDFGTNSLFRNRGDGTFEDVSTASGTADFATSMGVASGDLDNDGTSEIYVANMYSKMGRRIVGQVSKQDYPPGIYPRLQGACAGSRLYRFGNDLSSRCSEFSELAGVNKVGWAYAPTMADFNNDGLLDLYATCGFLSVDRSKPDG